MPLPQKRWFRIGEVAKHWAIPLSDIEDYALDEMLQLSVFVVDLPAEMGSWEGSRVGEGPALQDLPILNGPQPLQRGSLLEIFRDGQAEVRAFRAAQPNTYLHVRSDVPEMIVRRDDLIVTREERDRFEREHETVSAPGAPATMDVWHNDDFTRVQFAGARHKFGKKQAAVLQETGKLQCEACGFNFAATYGDLGIGFAECHHRLPLASLGSRTGTRLGDLAILCANCHRMIHKTRPLMSVEEFKSAVVVAQDQN